VPGSIGVQSGGVLAGAVVPALTDPPLEQPGTSAARSRGSRSAALMGRLSERDATKKGHVRNYGGTSRAVAAL
jgi:hypothetical protein